MKLFEKNNIHFLANLQKVCIFVHPLNFLQIHPTQISFKIVTVHRNVSKIIQIHNILVYM